MPMRTKVAVSNWNQIFGDFIGRIYGIFIILDGC
jgi:hypothetical protein